MGESSSIHLSFKIKLFTPLQLLLFPISLLCSHITNFRVLIFTVFPVSLVPHFNSFLRYENMTAKFFVVCDLSARKKKNKVARVFMLL